MLQNPQAKKLFQKCKIVGVRSEDYQSIPSMPKQSKALNQAILNQQGNNSEKQFMFQYVRQKINNHPKDSISINAFKQFHHLKNRALKQDFLSLQIGQLQRLPLIRRKQLGCKQPSVQLQHFSRIQNKQINFGSQLTRKNASQRKNVKATMDTRFETEERGRSPQPNFSIIHYSNIETNNPEIQYLNDNTSILQSIYYENGQQMEESEDSQESEYIKEAIPGPGHYSIKQPQFTSNTGKRDLSFGSKATRFRYKEQEQQLPPLKPHQKSRSGLKESNRKKTHAAFNSKSSKLTRDKHNAPGPCDYFVRFGMEEDLIRNIQKNFKSMARNERFPPKRQETLGPGAYLPRFQQPHLDSELGSYYFRSKISRF